MAGSLEREGVAALAHMEKALQLLDTFDPGVEVGAHLDLAICRLRGALEATTGTGPTTEEPPSG